MTKITLAIFLGALTSNLWWMAFVYKNPPTGVFAVMGTALAIIWICKETVEVES